MKLVLIGTATYMSNAILHHSFFESLKKSLQQYFQDDEILFANKAEDLEGLDNENCQFLFCCPNKQMIRSGGARRLAVPDFWNINELLFNMVFVEAVSAEYEDCTFAERRPRKTEGGVVVENHYLRCAMDRNYTVKGSDSWVVDGNHPWFKDFVLRLKMNAYRQYSEHYYKKLAQLTPDCERNDLITTPDIGNELFNKLNALEQYYQNQLPKSSPCVLTPDFSVQIKLEILSEIKKTLQKIIDAKKRGCDIDVKKEIRSILTEPSLTSISAHHRGIKGMLNELIDSMLRKLGFSLPRPFFQTKTEKVFDGISELLRP